MNTNITNITVDLSTANNFGVIRAVQGDMRTRFVYITLLDNQVEYDFDRVYPVLRGTKPDGTTIFNVCSVSEDNRIIVELSEQLLAAPGKITCEISLYSVSEQISEDKQVITSFPFTIFVSTAAFAPGAVTSTDEFTAIAEVIGNNAVLQECLDDIVASRDAAKVSEINAKEAEEAAMVSKEAASEAAKAAKTSETNAALSEQNASTYAENAANSATAAESEATAASGSASAARISETNAKVSETKAESSQTAAADSAAAAETSENHAAQSADSAAESAGVSAQKAGAAALSATNAADSADLASQKAAEAADSAHVASTKADESINGASIAAEQALLAQSYATGTDGTVRPGDAADNSKFFSDLARQLTNDAQRLLDQATKLVSAASVGAIIPAGTVAFADLPPAPTVGYMYNISDAFTTDARFVEGAGINYNAGANVYWTKDSQWDVMIGVQVTGVKGAAEPDYHQGNVNITPANIGLGNVNNTADADKVVKAAGTATKALQDANGNNIADTYLTKTGDTKDNIVTFASNDTNPACWTDIGLMQSGEKHGSILNKISTMFRNVRYIWQLIGNTQLSNIGDGTITGAISALNTGLTPISLPVEIYKPEYINEGPRVIVEYVSGIAIILVFFALGKPVPEWTYIEIAQVRKANFGTAYSTTATIGDNAAALLISINESGKILVTAHGAVTKTGWYYTSFPARCFYSN